MLYQFHSNRLEELAEQLITTLAKPMAGPLTPETLVVHGTGTRRWLSLQIATQQGIAGNLEYLFPAEFIWWLYRRQLPEVPITNAFDLPTLTWRVLAQLENQGELPTHETLTQYLSTTDEHGRWHLARRLARMYEQYLLYRPDWITRWEQGHDAKDWQASLWRQLMRHGDERHWLALQPALYRSLDGHSTAINLPSRLSLFALPTLSPGYLQTIQRVSEQTDVFLYTLNPSAVYWAQITSEKETLRATKRDEEVISHHFDLGNTLLASTGRQQREYFDLLLELEGQSIDCFSAPAETSLLGRIQADVFQLQDRSTGPLPNPNDDSIQVQVCHSPLREIEVLHDRLLDLFERHPHLTPGDVAVLAPDIEVFATSIEAVFGAVEGSRYIPFSISDQSLLVTSALVNTFFSLITLNDSRLEANEIIDLLDHSAVHHRFGLDHNDLSQVYQWISDIGVSWGLDDTALMTMDFPAGSVRTWRSAIERLLLGHALPAQDQFFMGRLAYPLHDTGQSRLVGHLVHFLEAIFNLQEQLFRARTATAWGTELNRVLDQFFSPEDEQENDLNRLREAIEVTAVEATTAGYDREFDLSVFRLSLEQQLKRSASSPLPAGRVTFGTLTVGRALPSAVICLIGLNDGDFPRLERTPGFDRLVKAPRFGDRRRRDEDRYLFLETILCAREALYLSYCGRERRDDTPVPPSVLISELLDYIAHAGDAGQDNGSVLTTEQPLQGFSHRYFSDPTHQRYFSYASERMPPTIDHQTKAPLLFPSALVTKPSDVLALAALVEFFQNPARYLLRHRLGVDLPRVRPAFDTRAPARVGFGALMAQREILLEIQLTGGQQVDAQTRLQAQALLRPGALGWLELAAEWSALSDLATRTAAIADLPQQRIEIDLSVGETTLRGQLDGVSTDAQYRHSVLDLRAADLITAWIMHLVLNLTPTSPTRHTRLVARDDTYTLPPVDHARELLTDLLACYSRGLSHPLPFFPRSAHAYAFASGNPSLAAKRCWQSSSYVNGEDANPWYQLAFRDEWDNLPNDEFVALTERLYQPIVDHLEGASP